MYSIRFYTINGATPDQALEAAVAMAKQLRIRYWFCSATSHSVFMQFQGSDEQLNTFERHFWSTQMLEADQAETRPALAVVA
jgi:hypothetical protein